MRYLLAITLLLAPLAAAESIVMDESEMCGSTAPRDVWDIPLCEDVHIDDDLLEAIELGDRSAVAMARKRYFEAATWIEKLQLGPALLDDAAVWADLNRRAEGVFDTDAEARPWKRALKAFSVVGADRRSNALMRKGLESKSPDLVAAAIEGLARQQDLDALPSIEKALARFPDEAWWVALSLQEYDGEAAARLLAKYGNDDDEE